ncbi:inositol monophosphatase, partial [bacterium]|nr:inositol monophosphatase [bacterium]
MSESPKNRMDEMQRTCIEAAHAGGGILMQGFRKLHHSQVDLKGIGDWVSQVDIDSEKAIVSCIRSRHPDHAIHAEESGRAESGSEWEWIIDPLDGTANFVHGIPIFSVSIAVMRKGATLLGVVFDPAGKELFSACKGGGAFLNGEPIQVSPKESIRDGLLASGFPWRSKDHLDAYLDSFRELFLKSAGIRRLGSAALDLAYTACGRFDGFWEMKLKPW